MALSTDFCFSNTVNEHASDYLPRMLTEMANELEYGIKRKLVMYDYNDLIDEVREAVNEFDPQNSQHMDHLWHLQDQLIEAFNENAKPYMIFDLDSTGRRWCWQINEWEMACANVATVEDLSELDEDFQGDVVVVDDHGGSTLYHVTDDDAKLIWSVG